MVLSTSLIQDHYNFALLKLEGRHKNRQELHASPHIEHFPILSYPYISIYGYALSIYGYVG